MYVDYLDSIIGIICVKANDEYLLRIALVDEKEERKSNHITDLTIMQLNEYFSKERKYFDLPLLFNKTEFQNTIYKNLYKIEYGKVISYKELAILCGKDKAYRSLGTSVGNNPYPIIVPCHRVIKNNGELGNYYYGSKIKKELLKLEGYYK